MANVLLLRAPSPDLPDPYEKCLRDYGFGAASVPVLETVFAPIEGLKQKILLGPHAQGLSGVIITSSRACEAWGRAVKEIAQEPLGADQAADWTSTPFYVVGEATAAALIGETFGLGSLAPRIIRGGSQTGTSERLARYVLHNLPAKEGIKLLYLTGDKNSDTLSEIIRQGGGELDFIKVYETQGSQSFAENLVRAIHSIPADVDRWWIVFFAPSAALFATPILRQYFDLPGAESQGGMYLSGVRLAAIGPTTRDFLQNRLSLRVSVCPSMPTAEGVACAIENYKN